MAQKESWPPGFGFHPTDEEIMQYLEEKKHNHNFAVKDYIPEISINDYDPWEIFEVLSKGSDDEKCHFFSPRKFKHSKSSTSTVVDRVTKSGFWKASGARRNATTQGMKQVFVFHMGRPNNERRTEWIIHDYELNDLKEFVLCRLRHKQDDDTYHPGESSSKTPLSTKDQPTEEVSKAPCPE